ncbi:MAG: N-formylglutamate amidohydrolase [Hyphomicrobiales bacterium]
MASTVDVINRSGRTPVVLVCEHASSFIPPEFANLGLSEETAKSHIAWDPGALSVAEHLTEILDAPLIAQKTSRLLYDCNRHPSAPDAVPAKSEIYDIPGNTGLSQADINVRAARFYEPFRKQINAVMEQKSQNGFPPVLVTIHSFTPIYYGKPRSVELGILHDNDIRLANNLLNELGNETNLNVERNQPYGPQDGVTHTLIEHGIKRGALNVMLEIRNDLIVRENSQKEMASLLGPALISSIAELDCKITAHLSEAEQL